MSENTSPHDGKYFVIQKGKAQCNQGNQFPQFKVTSHQKHYWNNKDGQADYLAVTEDDHSLLHWSQLWAMQTETKFRRLSPLRFCTCWKMAKTL